MDRGKTLISVAVCIVVILGAMKLSTGSDRVNAPIVVLVEPDMPMAKNAPINLRLTYALDPIWNGFASVDTGSFSATITGPWDYSDTISSTTYHVTYSQTFAFYDILQKYSTEPIVKREHQSLSYTGSFQIPVPYADTFCLHLNLMIGHKHLNYKYFFTTTGDYIQFFDNYLMPAEFIYRRTDFGRQTMEKTDRDTLTIEQLQTKVDMAVNLNDPQRFRLAKEILGDIPDTCKWSRFPGQYIINMTLEQAFKLSDKGIGIEATKAKKKKQSDSGLRKVLCPRMPQWTRCPM